MSVENSTCDILLYRRWLLLTHAGQTFLNPAREFVLTSELDLRVFFGHPKGAVAGDLRCFDARPTHRLPPRNVGASEGVRPKAREIAALRLSRPLQSLTYT